MREGIGFGKVNNEGYNNLYEYEHGMNIDVLVMGSSHMEAVQMRQNENASSVLASLSGLRVYNIGISAHSFAICSQNLQAAVKKYHPSKYIVIETSSASFTNSVLEEIISSHVPAKERGGLRLLMRKNPYFLLLWIQANDYIGNNFSHPVQKNSYETNKKNILLKLFNLSPITMPHNQRIVFFAHLMETKHFNRSQTKMRPSPTNSIQPLRQRH